MYARLLRLDGRQLEDIAPERRSVALDVLSRAFPDVDVARAVLATMEASQRRPWTASEDEKVRRLYPDTDTKVLAGMLGRTVCAIYGAANRLGVDKSEDFIRAQLAGNGVKLQESGKAHRFPKGHVPWSNGRKGLDLGGRSHETRFKKGQVLASRCFPIGTEVIDGDGYLKRKVTDSRSVPSRFNWRYVHVIVWEEHNGRPVPPGHIVTFKDGDKANVDPSNLELISMADNAMRNRWQIPLELARTVRTLAKLKRVIRRRTEKEKAS